MPTQVAYVQIMLQPGRVILILELSKVVYVLIMLQSGRVIRIYLTYPGCLRSDNATTWKSN